MVQEPLPDSFLVGLELLEPMGELGSRGGGGYGSEAGLIAAIDKDDGGEELIIWGVRQPLQGVHEINRRIDGCVQWVGKKWKSWRKS